MANMLFSKGLAATRWDAKNKAKDILGLSDRNMEQQDSGVSKIVRDNSVDEIMQNLGVGEQEIKQAEEKKIEEVKEEFEKKLDEEQTEAVSDFSELAKESQEPDTVQLPDDIMSHATEPESTEVQTEQSSTLLEDNQEMVEKEEPLSQQQEDFYEGNEPAEDSGYKDEQEEGSVLTKEAAWEESTESETESGVIEEKDREHAEVESGIKQTTSTESDMPDDVEISEGDLEQDETLEQRESADEPIEVEDTELDQNSDDMMNLEEPSAPEHEKLEEDRHDQDSDNEEESSQNMVEERDEDDSNRVAEKAESDDIKESNGVESGEPMDQARDSLTEDPAGSEDSEDYIYFGEKEPVKNLDEDHVANDDSTESDQEEVSMDNEAYKKENVFSEVDNSKMDDDDGENNGEPDAENDEEESGRSFF
jgi:hypothetical protein